MKKLKILIPALSIASVGAVVAPMVTSCSKAYLGVHDDTALNFKGDKQYKDGTATTISNKTEAEALSTEYFNDPKVLAQDIIYSLLDGAREEETDWKSQKEQGKIESYKVRVDLSIDKYSVAEKELDLGTYESLTFGTVKGVLINAAISGTISTEVVEKPDSETKIQEIVQINTTIGMNLTNCFICLNPYTYKKESRTYLSPSIMIIGHKDLDWSYSTDGIEVETDITKNTETGATSTLAEGSTIKAINNRKMAGEDLYQINSISAKTLYYLEKVTFTEFTPSNN